MQSRQRWRIWKAEADVELLRLVPPAASANCDAASLERFKLKALAAEASWRQLQLRSDQLRCWCKCCRNRQFSGIQTAAYAQGKQARTAE
jgi:hypothetical protein